MCEGDLLRIQWRLTLGGGGSWFTLDCDRVIYDQSVIMKPQEDWPTDGSACRDIRGKLMTDLLEHNSLSVAGNSYKIYCKISDPKY